MKKVLSSYSLIIALFAGAVIAPVAVSAIAPSSENSGIAELAKVDKPVFLFKTTSKDPYSLTYRPGSNTLELLLFGYYPGTGARVFHVTKPKLQLSGLMPIRMTKLFIDGSVKIDEKFPGYRESTIGCILEDVFKATEILPEHYYKGIPFVDQYCEAMPFKLVFNSVEEASALRGYLQPLFEKSALLSKNLVKPVLVLEIDHAEKTLPQGDADFFSTYFTVCDPSEVTIKAFFDAQQEPINKAIARLKDAKPVKESFSEIIFHKIESASSEFKMKEAGAAAAYLVIAAVTFDIAKSYIPEMTKHAKGHVHTNAVEPVLHRIHGKKKPDSNEYEIEPNHTLRNGLLVAGGLLGASLLTAGATAAVVD